MNYKLNVISFKSDGISANSTCQGALSIFFTAALSNDFFQGAKGVSPFLYTTVDIWSKALCLP